MAQTPLSSLTLLFCSGLQEMPPLPAQPVPSQLGSRFSSLPHKSCCFMNRNTHNPTGARMCSFLTVSHEHAPSGKSLMLAFYTGCKLNGGIAWFIWLFLLASNQNGKLSLFKKLSDQRPTYQTMVLMLQKEGVVSGSGRLR